MGRAKIITVVARKGGVLKTTICTNLAGVFADQKKKVLIIDMDSQANCLVSFGKNPDELNYTLRDVLTGRLDYKNWEWSKVKVHRRIDVVSSNDEMLDFEFEVIKNRDRYTKPFYLLKTFINNVVYDYDYIIVDTPPNFGLVQANALVVADITLVPFQPETYSLRSLVKIMDTIREFKSEYNSGMTEAYVIGTMVDIRTTLHRNILEKTSEFCKQNKIRMLETYIPKSIQFASTIAFQKGPLTICNGHSVMAKCFYDLKEEMFGHG